MSSLLGGDQSQTTTSNHTVTFPKWIDPQMQQFFTDSLSKSMNLGNTPYEAYGGQRQAGFTPDEQASFDLVRNMTGQSGADVSEAQGLTRQVAQQGLNGPSASQFANYYNPYITNVLDSNRDRALRDFDVQKNQLHSQQANTGAFGGSRSALASGQLYDNFNRGLRDQESNLMYQGYNDAQNRAYQGAQMTGQSAQQLAQMAQMQQGIGLQNAGALSAQGQQQRGLTQQGLDTDYQDWLTQKQYPYSQLQYQESMGLPLAQTVAGAHDVSTTTSSGGSGLLGTALGVGSMLMGMPPVGALGGTMFGSAMSGLGSMFSGMGGGNSLASAGNWGGGGYTPWGGKTGGMVPGYADGGQVGGHTPFMGALGGLNLGQIQAASNPATNPGQPMLGSQQPIMGQGQWPKNTPSMYSMPGSPNQFMPSYMLPNLKHGEYANARHDFYHGIRSPLAPQGPAPIGGHMPFLGLAGMNQFPAAQGGLSNLGAVPNPSVMMRMGGQVPFKRSGDGQHEYGSYKMGGCVMPHFDEGGGVGNYFPSIGGMAPEDFWTQNAAQPSSAPAPDDGSSWYDALRDTGSIGKMLQKPADYYRKNPVDATTNAMLAMSGLGEFAGPAVSGAKAAAGPLAATLSKGFGILMKSPTASLGAYKMFSSMSGDDLKKLAASPKGKAALAAAKSDYNGTGQEDSLLTALTAQQNARDQGVVGDSSINNGAGPLGAAGSLPIGKSGKPLGPEVHSVLMGMGLMQPASGDTPVDLAAAEEPTKEPTKAEMNTPLIAFGAALLGSHNSFFKALGEAGKAGVVASENKEDRISKMAQQGIENKLNTMKALAYAQQVQQSGQNGPWDGLIKQAKYRQLQQQLETGNVLKMTNNIYSNMKKDPMLSMKMDDATMWAEAGKRAAQQAGMLGPSSASDDGGGWSGSVVE